MIYTEAAGQRARERKAAGPVEQEGEPAEQAAGPAEQEAEPAEQEAGPVEQETDPVEQEMKRQAQ